MTQEEKQLLLIDLCARLPYEVMLNVTLIGKYDEYIHRDIELTSHNISYITSNSHWLDYKPYLRPMSSMTEDEKDEYNSHITGIQSGIDAANLMVWIYQHHLDVFHLIEKGLALEAPEGMYKTE